MFDRYECDQRFHKIAAVLVNLSKIMRTKFTLILDFSCFRTDQSSLFGHQKFHRKMKKIHFCVSHLNKILEKSFHLRLSPFLSFFHASFIMNMRKLPPKLCTNAFLLIFLVFVFKLFIHFCFPIHKNINNTKNGPKNIKQQ